MRQDRRMSYARSRPVRSPDGRYYEVAASPRGDFLLYMSETGPATWLTGNTGSLGLASLIVNATLYRGRWRIVVKAAQTSRAASPTSGVLFSRDVRRREVDQGMNELARSIETDGLETAIDRAKRGAPQDR